MNKAVTVEEAEKPLDPAMEKVRRKMIRLLMISIGVMMAGLMAVLFAIVYKMNDKPAVTAASGATIPVGVDEISGTIALPQGAQINSNSISGTQILMDLTLLDGKRELMVFDVAQNRVVARYTLTNTK
jgi:hypothetical protein